MFLPPRPLAKLGGEGENVLYHASQGPWEGSQWSIHTLKEFQALFLETFLAEYYLSDSAQRLNAKIPGWDRYMIFFFLIINYFCLT